MKFISLPNYRFSTCSPFNAVFSKTVCTLFHLVHEICFSFTFGPNAHCKLDFGIRWKNVNISTIFLNFSKKENSGGGKSGFYGGCAITVNFRFHIVWAVCGLLWGKHKYPFQTLIYGCVVWLLPMVHNILTVIYSFCY